jgi:hypothetical protein
MFHAIIKKLKSMKAVLVHNVPLIPANNTKTKKKKTSHPLVVWMTCKHDCAVIQIYYKIHFESNGIDGRSFPGQNLKINCRLKTTINLMAVLL